MSAIDWVQNGLIAGLTVALITSQLAVWRHFRSHDEHERAELEAEKRRLGLRTDEED